MYKRTILVLGVLLFIAATAIMAAGAGGKMPVTTSSDPARADYLKGLNLADNLKIQESQQYFRKAVQEDPKFAIAFLNLAFSEPVANDFFKDLNQAVKLAGGASEGERLWILSADAAAKGLPNQQGEYLEKLVAAYPKEERAHHLQGVFNFGLQKYDKAIENFQQAVTINPKFAPSYNLLGYSYRFHGDFDKSEQAFKKYIEQIPDDPNPYDSYAELLMKLGRYDESIANYEKALKKDSHFVNSYVGIATNLNFKGDHANARKELEQLYGIARNDGERRTALLGTTISYVDEGNWQKAIEEQERMFQLSQKDPATATGDLNTIGTILLENGRSKEAQSRFDEAEKIVSESNLSDEVKTIAARNHTFFSAKVALQIGDLTKAHKLADDYRTQAKAEKNPFLISLSHELDGSIALQEKKYDAAISELQNSNMQDPYNPYRLALAYRGKGDAAKAKEYFGRVANFNGLNNLNLALIRNKAKQALAM